ncbi:hypothetical protein [Streptomyces sp. CoH17]|uniref:hypothetical protein n=1 Tax=Streptomyces sp. CoH17 TaxID=2992806 RepID=UPI0022712B4C|nr:hypothetical protein [Streptomyces sp. CoH17]
MELEQAKQAMRNGSKVRGTSGVRSHEGKIEDLFQWHPNLGRVPVGVYPGLKDKPIFFSVWWYLGDTAMRTSATYRAEELELVE